MESKAMSIGIGIAQMTSQILRIAADDARPKPSSRVAADVLKADLGMLILPVLCFGDG